MGFYISIGTTLAIFCGGIVRWLVERAATKAGEKKDESDVSPGSLYASGLIAAGGVVGLIGIVVKLLENSPADKWYHIKEGVLVLGKHFPAIGGSNLMSVLMFAVLMASVYYFARKPLASDKK